METSISTIITTECSICGKILSSKQNLKQHMNIHTGERPFRCCYSGCSASYKHASQLSNHKIIHKPTTVKAKYNFDVLKDFTQLIILALGPESRIEYDVPSGPFKVEDVCLPPILIPQDGIKLPLFSL